MAIDVLSNHQAQKIERPNDYYPIKSNPTQITNAGEKINTDKLQLQKANFEQKLNMSQAQLTPPQINSRGAKLEQQIPVENGTDIALKDLSIQMEKQILGIMWNLAFQSIDKEYEGGTGEELFHQELVNEMVKYTRDGEMGDIAASIYRDLQQNKE